MREDGSVASCHFDGSWMHDGRAPGLPPSAGDRLDPAGNDHPVLETGIATRAVSDWTATADFIRSFLDDGEGDCSRFTASPLTGGRPTAETTPTHH